MDHTHLYTAKNMSSSKWPSTVDGQYAKNYLHPFMRRGSKHYIANVDTEMITMQVGDIVLPVTVNSTEYKNAYVCSPYTHYVTYAKEELCLLPNRMLQAMLHTVITALGWYLQYGQINQVVTVNNWLLATNLYPSLTMDQLGAITEKIASLFPNHAIIFRSVNDYTPEGLLTNLDNLGYQRVLSRQVYFYDPMSTTSRVNRDLKNDRKLLEHSSYEVVDHFSDEDIPRITRLYNMLYLDKYSQNNPHFNKHYIQLALQKKTLSLRGLKREGRLDGIVGFFTRNGVMTTPLFGYDTTLPQKVGLYRMLSALLVREATQQQLLLHQSSGAAPFKRLRNAFPALEYTMVYTKHLPKKQRRMWSFLSRVMEHVAKPLLQKYEL